MRKLLKKLIPRKVMKQISPIILKNRVKNEFKEDYNRYVKHAFIFTKNKEKRHYEADLIFYYHKIEKGLALPEPRIEFGKKNVIHLFEILEKYVGRYGWDRISVTSFNTLVEYYKFNERNGVKLNSLYEKIKKMELTIPTSLKSNEGGIKEVTKNQIDQSNIDFKTFAYSRYSIRNFTKQKVDRELIENAIEISQKTPSVCNRQSAKVHVYESMEDKNRILKYQNGNAGFGNHADKILIVTMELGDFRGIIERNQSYIDGGMYAMSLIYSLHAQGLGTCPLNLSIINDTEQKLKRAANISDSEQLIMMIAVGHIPSSLKVACSPRRFGNEVTTFH